MPTYEYKCSSCGHQFELFQSMKDSPKRKCPECGKNALERLIGTGAAVIFKGSGFYQTDYRSEAYKKAASADKGEKSDKPAESSSGGSSEPAKSEPSKDTAKPAETKAADKPKADPKPGKKPKGQS